VRGILLVIEIKQDSMHVFDAEARTTSFGYVYLKKKRVARMCAVLV
jgi:hypothetical protein